MLPSLKVWYVVMYPGTSPVIFRFNAPTTPSQSKTYLAPSVSFFCPCRLTSTNPSFSVQERAAMPSMTSAPLSSAFLASHPSKWLRHTLSPSCSNRYSFPMSFVNIMPLLSVGVHMADSGTSSPK